MIALLHSVQAQVLQMSLQDVQEAQRHSGVANEHAGQAAKAALVPEAMQRMTSE